MTSYDTPASRHAARSARRWARALYHAAFGEPPHELTVTGAPSISATIINFIAYPSANQAPLSVAVSALRREASHAAPILALAQRFESTLKLAIAPVTSEAAQPRFEEDPCPQAAAIARGPGGALTVVEHERNRANHHQPWLHGDALRLSLPVPVHTRSGLLIPQLPIEANLSSPEDGLDLPVLLTPTRGHLTAKCVASVAPPPNDHTTARWTGTVKACIPPFGLHLLLNDPGSLAGSPFATATWVESEDRFAIRLLQQPQNDEDGEST